MRLVDVTDDDRRALDTALRTARRVREWRRLQAVRRLADGQEAPAVAQALGCSASSVSYWANDWREIGREGLVEGPHAGRPRRLDGDAEAMLTQVLTDDRQTDGYAASDWTAPAACVHTSSLRRLRRSTHTPANGPSKNETI